MYIVILVLHGVKKKPPSRGGEGLTSRSRAVESGGDPVAQGSSW